MVIFEKLIIKQVRQKWWFYWAGWWKMVEIWFEKGEKYR